MAETRGEPMWLQWAHRIQSIAQAGLTYGRDQYDIQRYRSLQQIALEIVSQHTTVPHETLSQVMLSETGYLTPKVDVRAVVFSQEGKLLLVRETTDGLWSLPGGWADVGESPSEVAAREVLEESGYRVRPAKVLAILDRARHDHPPLLWYVYKVFIQCELIGGAPETSLETDEVAFVDRTSIPALSVTRVTEAQIRRAFEHWDDPLLPTDFD